MATAPSSNSTAKVGTLGLGSPVASVPPKSQRGQNKPKCKQCGNVARSRSLIQFYHFFSSLLCFDSVINFNSNTIVIILFYRCPYENCKSCCSRNQNPCPIHGPFPSSFHLKLFFFLLFSFGCVLFSSTCFWWCLYSYDFDDKTLNAQAV